MGKSKSLRLSFLPVSALCLVMTRERLVASPHFKSCDHILGKFQYYATFCTHGKTLHGKKYVIGFRSYFIKRLMTYVDEGEVAVFSAKLLDRRNS